MKGCKYCNHCQKKDGKNFCNVKKNEIPEENYNGEVDMSKCSGYDVQDHG